MDELTLHRYLDGRLDERQRSQVEAALRTDPAARRTLDALREEARLLGSSMEAQVEPPSGAGRIGARVMATLHLEERSRVASFRTRKLFRRSMWVASFAAALVLCFLLVRPRNPAGSFLSGTHATLTVHGEKREGLKGLHVYDGDGISTEKGQFVRVGLAGAQTIDIDEFSELTIEKSGSSPVLRMTRGRVGVAVGDNQSAVQFDLPQGRVTVQPGCRADIWMPVAAAPRWPDVFYGPQPLRAVATKAEPTAIVTLFAGFAQIACEKSTASLTARAGMRALVTQADITARWVNLAGSRVLDVRGDDGLHARDNVSPLEWTLLGVMEKPQFEVLGKRWGLSGSESAGNTRIDEALKQLDGAMQLKAPNERAEKLAEGLQALRQACETLAQNDYHRRIGLTLEGLAHFEQGCARFTAGTRQDSDPLVSFEAARVAFDAALAPVSNPTGVAVPNPAADWRTAFSAGVNSSGGAVAMSALAPEAQAALTASFRRAVVLAWSARIMPPQLNELACQNATADETDKSESIRVASEAFAQLHDELGHTTESLAALLGEALCDLHAHNDAARTRALDALHVIVSQPIAGTDGGARQALEGIREAALIELVRVNACGADARKTLNAAHDYELTFPLDSGATPTTDVRKLLIRGLEAQKDAAFKDKRFDNAADACDALLAALDEDDGHWLDATQVDSGTPIRHIGVRLDRLDALVSAKDWVRAAAEINLIKGSMPAELQSRFSALQLAMHNAQ